MALTNETEVTTATFRSSHCDLQVGLAAVPAIIENDGNMQNLFEIIDVDRAEELLAELHAHSGRRWDGSHAEDETGWIYRGQANAAWSLTPSVFRPGALGFRRPPTRTLEWPPADRLEHAQQELALVLDFCTLVDRQGLEVPGDTPTFREMAEDYWRRDHDFKNFHKHSSAPCSRSHSTSVFPRDS